MLLKGGWAQTYNFNRFQVDNGLSNNSVLCSLQDREGFMWFGTKDGLNRYDGYTFKLYNFDQEFGRIRANNAIKSLLLSANGVLWVGTDKGLFRYHAALDRFSAIGAEAFGPVDHIAEDKAGNIVFLADGRLMRYEVARQRLDRVPEAADYRMASFCVDQKGELWGFAEGALRAIFAKKRYKLPVANQGGIWVTVIKEDLAGNIWVGTAKQGIFKWDRRTSAISHPLSANVAQEPLFIRDICEVAPGIFWLATETGLVLYDSAKDIARFVSHERDNPWSLSDNALYTICKDDQGGIWLGSYFGGVNYFHPSHNAFGKFFPRAEGSSLAGHAVREMLIDNAGFMWVGTEDNGLSRWDRATHTFRNFSLSAGLSHTNIHGLALAGDSLLVGTFDRGMDVLSVRTGRLLAHFDRTQTSGALTNDFVHHIMRTRGGRYILSTGYGACEFIPGENRFIPIPGFPEGKFFSMMYEDKAGLWWVGTFQSGLFVYHPQQPEKGLQPVQERMQKPVDFTHVHFMTQDRFEKIWIATEAGLLQLSAQGELLRTFSKKDGLPSNHIVGVQEDRQGDLWIATTLGLLRMKNPDFEKKLFDKEQGLLDLQFNYNATFQDPEGFLYFGTTKGLLRFDPQQLKDITFSNVKLPLYITGVKVLNKELIVGQDVDTAVTFLNHIQLPYNESTITLQFAALNYRATHSTLYRYKLLGFDSSWTILKDAQQAYFTKLPPGKYSFVVEAIDANLRPLSDRRLLNITVHPPLWATPWAYLAYVFLGLTFIFMLVFTYNKRVKKQNKQRLEAFRRRQERDLQQSKLDFFAQIAHEIKTPLTLIKAPLERVLALNTDNPRMEKYLRTMDNNTEKLIGLTGKLLDFQRLEQQQWQLSPACCNVSALLEGILAEYFPLIEKRGLAVDTAACSTEIWAFLDLEILTKIIDNLLSNAVKYADHSIRLSLELDKLAQEFVLVLMNDGRLITEADAARIFKPFQRSKSHYQIAGTGLGLALAKSFTALIDGRLDLVPNVDGWNIFKLTVPIQRPTVESN